MSDNANVSLGSNADTQEGGIVFYDEISARKAAPKIKVYAFGGPVLPAAPMNRRARRAQR